MRTVITHFYNEEYLLPWWLEHHKKIFDHGILIDYASTDNSVKIIKEICPNWEIVQSVNPEFASFACDREVEHYESKLSGWRMALTTSEFLVGDVDKLMYETTENKDYNVPEIRFIEWDLSREFDRKKPLWEQATKGIPYNDFSVAYGARHLHNYSGYRYPLGRHVDASLYNTEDACVLHYGYCVVGLPMLKRRLQIQNRIPKAEIEGGELGWQHHNYGKGLDVISAKEMTEGRLSKGVIDCSEIIDRITKK